MIALAMFVIAGNLAAWALVRHSAMRADYYDRMTGRVLVA